MKPAACFKIFLCAADDTVCCEIAELRNDSFDSATDEPCSLFSVEASIVSPLRERPRSCNCWTMSSTRFQRWEMRPGLSARSPRFFLRGEGSVLFSLFLDLTCSCWFCILMISRNVRSFHLEFWIQICQGLEVSTFCENLKFPDVSETE